jgi:hypothetical protein
LDLQCLPLPFNTLQSSVVADRAKIFAALARRGIKPTGEAAQDEAHKLQTAPASSSDKASAPKLSDGQLALAAREWEKLGGQGDVKSLKRFASHYADTYHAELAKERIEMLTDAIEEVQRKEREELEQRKRIEEEERPEKEAWRAVLAERDAALAAKFLEQFFNGKYAEEAKKRLR